LISCQQNNISGRAVASDFGILAKTNASQSNYTYYGEQNDSKAGADAVFGYFNNDSAKDLLIGDPGYDSGTGKGYVVLGPFKNGSHNLSKSNFSLFGEESGSELGWAVAVGDLDNDGKGDLLLGARNYSNTTGRAYLVYGQDNLSGNFKVNTSDIVFTGENNGDKAGYSLAMGDLTGDNYDEVIIGAPFSDGGGGSTDVGRVYVFYGPNISSNLSLASANATFDGAANNDGIGADVAVADVNGDGIGDLIVGGADQGFVVYGPISSGLIPINIVANVTLNGTSNAWFGTLELYHFHLSVGDVNNDSIDDVLIGTPYDLEYGGMWGSGRAFLVYGNNSLPVSIDLNTTLPQWIPEAADDAAGYTVAITDNGEAIITAPANDEYGTSSGKIYLFEPPLLNKTYNLSEANDTWHGSQAQMSLGIARVGCKVFCSMIEASSPQGCFLFDVNKAPTADVGGPYSSNEGTVINFDASGSTDPESDPLEFRWDLDNDGFWDTAWSLSSTTSNTWNDDYNDLVVVQVRDDQGNYDEDTGTVTVNNVDPVAGTTGPYNVNEGSAATVTITETDPGADTFTYSFDWDNNAVYDIVDQAADNAQYTWNDDGVNTVGVKVKDDDGGEDTTTTVVTVNNVDPIAAASNNGPVVENNPVTVSVGVTDPGTLDTHTYSFDWNNDGTYDIVDQAGSSAQHTFASAGTYTVKVKAKDDDGGEGTDTTDVIVNAPAPAPSRGGGGGRSISTKSTVQFITPKPYYPGNQLNVRIVSDASSGVFKIGDWDLQLSFTGGKKINGQYTRIVSFPVPDYAAVNQAIFWGVFIGGLKSNEGKIIINSPSTKPEPTSEETPESKDEPEEEGYCVECPEKCEKPDKPEIKEKPPKEEYPGEAGFASGSIGSGGICGPGSGARPSAGGIGPIEQIGGQQPQAAPTPAAPSSVGQTGTQPSGKKSFEMGPIGMAIQTLLTPLNLITGQQIIDTGDVKEKIKDLTSGILEDQEEANLECPPQQICVVGGQCIPICESETHLLITEFGAGSTFIEIFNPLTKTIELDNYLIQGIPFPAGSVIESQQYLIVSDSESFGDIYLPELEIDLKGDVIVLSYEDMGGEKLVDYIPYGSHSTTEFIYEEGDTLPIDQHLVYMAPRTVDNDFILTELVVDWDQRIYYAEFTNVGPYVYETEDIEIRFYAGDDYFYGRMPYLKVAPGESIVVRFDSFFADENEDPDDRGPILTEEIEYISFDDFTHRTKTIQNGFMPVLELTLYEVVDDGIEEIVDSEDFFEFEVAVEEGRMNVLDYFIRELPDVMDFDRGRFVYQNAVQNTFVTSIVNFRPSDFVEKKANQFLEPAPKHSLGTIEYFDELLVGLEKEGRVTAGEADIALTGIGPETQPGTVSQIQGGAVAAQFDVDVPAGEPEQQLTESGTVEFSSKEDQFARPCAKIIKFYPEHSFYEACQSAQTSIEYGYSLVGDNAFTLQRIIYDEEEKEGGRGIDGKDPTSEKVGEHFDLLKPSPGEAMP